MDYSEDPESAPRGGDMGLVPVSRLKQAPPQLRDAVLSKKPGAANVVTIGGAHSIVLVVAHELAGQRDLATPGMQDRITETLRERKAQLLRAAYLTAVREDAQVVNYLARRLVESQGKMPSIQPATPIARKVSSSTAIPTPGAASAVSRCDRSGRHSWQIRTGTYSPFPPVLSPCAGSQEPSHACRHSRCNYPGR